MNRFVANPRHLLRGMHLNLLGFLPRLEERGCGVRHRWQRHDGQRQCRLRGLAAETRGAAEDARQRVVIAGRKRVELVVMAACAADADAEQRTAEHLHLLVHPIELLPLRIAVRPDDVTDGKIGRGHEIFRPVLG